jgi:hypothetical protein
VDDTFDGNLTLTGALRGPATFTIDPAGIGDNTGTVVIAGNLQVDGTTTTINSTTLTVDDKNIVLADGAANAAAADGAGITIDGANAALTYVSASDTLEVNKSFRVADSSDMGFGTTKAGSSVGHNASVDEGIFWHTTNDYGIYRTAGAWNSPDYPYLKVAFGTGIKLDGGTAGQYTHTGVDIVGGSDLQMAGVTVIDASRNITAGTISANGGNSSQWNTAYGWGNHASAGYLTSLGWATSDTFTGTYSLAWNASNTLYTASWLQVRGSDDTLLTRNISVASGYAYEIGNIIAIEEASNYLRINQSNQFSNGIWIGSSNLYGSQGNITLGSNGSVSTSRVWIAPGAYNGSNVIKIDGANGQITSLRNNSPILSIERANNTASGISWYSPGYKAWTTYMTSPGASTGPFGNITAPSGTLVTSWALRSFIENVGGYGWTFESGSATGNPSVVAEIRSSDGSARFGGLVNAVSGYQVNGTTVIDSSRRNIYLDSFAGGNNNGIFFRTGFTSSSLGYNCSITVQDHNGASADGLHISGYDGVGIGTGANTYSVDLLVDVAGNTNVYGHLNSVNGYQVNGTTVIDSSRNLTNIGSISSTGQITGDDVRVTAGDGEGYGFWSSALGGSYRIYMSSASNSTYGGQVTGETTSDYNMYFKMQSGTNRGFVFRDDANNFFSINPDSGVHSEVPFYGPRLFAPYITGTNGSSSDDILLTRWRYADADSYYLDMHQRVTSNQLRWAFSVHNNGSTWNDRLVFKNANVGIGGIQDPAYALDVKSDGSDVARFVAASGNDALVRIIAADYATEYDARLFLGEADAYGMTFEYDGAANVGYIGMNNNVDPTGAYSKRISMSRGGTEVKFPGGVVEIGSVLTLQNSSDRSGLLDIQNTGQSWTGVQFTRAAGDHWSLMGDDGNFGAYDDQFGEWIFLYTQNAGTNFYYNGASRLVVDSLGFSSSQRYIANQGGSSRDAGYYGSYDPTRLAHIWSMGTAYDISADGTSASNIYGLTYSYNPNYQGTGNNPGAISGLGHQMQWRNAGTTQSAIGTGIYTIGNVTAYSDRRVKTNIERIPDALDKVCRLNGYTYERTDLSEKDEATGEKQVVRQAGVIAQEVLEVLPEVVTGSEELHYGVAYGNMVGLLIEAIKELKDEVDSLKVQLKEKDNGDH